MRTEQRKPGFTCVIESLGVPVRRRMAFTAVGATGASMRIVGCVARDALSRRAFVTVAEVACDARNVGVLAGKREVGRAVIELDVCPSDRVMAGSAVFAQFALMRLVGLMASKAARRRIAVTLARCVTASAIEQRVSIAQWEIAAVMIELLGNELDDVGVSALMLTVAGPALQALAADEPTMKAFAAAQILSNLFMAGGAQLRLAAPVAAVVTVGALCFDIRMRGRDLARHEQGLDLGRAGRRTEGERHHQKRKQTDRMT